MATWTQPSKNSATFTNDSKSGQGTTIPTGTPMGLLLALTYASDQTSSGITWTNSSKNSATFTNVTKN